MSPRAATFIGLTALYALIVFNAWDPTLLLPGAWANYVFFGIAQLIPLALAALAISTGVWWARILRVIALLPVLALSLVFATCATVGGRLTLARGSDPSFMKLETVSLDTGRLSIYRTDGGATTSIGIVVRQECRFLPGILRVRKVWGAYPADEVDAKVLDGQRVRFSVRPYGSPRAPEFAEVVDIQPLRCPADP